MNTLTFPFRLGLIGYPLGHSLSPRIHNAALRAAGLLGEYALYPVSPQSEEAEISIQRLLGLLRMGEIHGLNITIPYKQTIIPLLDDLTPTARAVGAVNTIFRCAERIIGDNTDAPGFWADVQQLWDREPPPPRRALILGAGGSARAVAYALLTHGYEIVVAARRLEQANALRQSLAAVSDGVQTIDLSPSSIDRFTRLSHLIVNATPVGMYPDVDDSPWPLMVPFPQKAVLYDLVYNPAETSLVARARSAGLTAVTGTGMLVEQAALAFERWTGHQAPRRAMRAAATSEQVNQ